MGTLLAEMTVLDGSHGLFAGAGAALAVAVMMFFNKARGGSNAATSAPDVAAVANDFAIDSNPEELGPFKALFAALAKNDRAKVGSAFTELSILSRYAGGFGSLLKTLVFSQIKAYLSDPAKRKELLDFIGNLLGLALANMVAEAQAAGRAAGGVVKSTARRVKPSAASVATVAAPLLLFGLLLALPQPAAAFGPELYYRTPSGATLDPPTYPGYAAQAVQQPYRPANWGPINPPTEHGFVVQPQQVAYYGDGQYCYQQDRRVFYGPRSGVGFWQRGPVRRFFANGGIFRRLFRRRC